MRKVCSNMKKRAIVAACMALLFCFAPALAAEAVRSGSMDVSEPLVNLYQPTAEGWVDEAFILSSGEVKVYPEWYKSYMVSPPIPVEGGRIYTLAPMILPEDIKDANRLRAYAADGTALPTVTLVENSDGSRTFIVPRETAYIRITASKMTLTGSRDFSRALAEFNSRFMLVAGASAPQTSIPNRKEKGGADSVASGETPAASPLAGKTIANFGDSIFGNARPPHDISTMLAGRTGATVYNCAFGGCRMGRHVGHWDAFSMYRLAQAIASGDYSLQEEALKFEDRTSYAQEPLALIQSIDFSTLDILTIAYGTNDFTGSNPIDNADNPLDPSTVCGALRYSIETLLAAYPQLHIFVLLPTWRFVMDDDGNFVEDSSTMTNGLGRTLPDYVQAIAETARAYNLPVIDNYYGLGINRFNRAQYFGGKDGVHQNEAGRERIAERLAHELW